LVGFLS